MDVPPWARVAFTEGMITPLDVLRYGYPAHPAAVILAHGTTSLARSGSAAGWLAARRELRQLTDAHLGTDPEAWTLAVRLLPEFGGTIPELLATTAAVVS